MEPEQPKPPKSPRKSRKSVLTPRQNLLVKNLAKGKTLTAAAINAGYSPNGAAQTATNALEAIARKAPSMLERLGLSEESVTEKYLKPALEAHETKFFQSDGKVTDSRRVVAWGPRLTALDLYYRLSGSYKSDQNPGALKVQVVVLSADHRPVLDIPRNGNGNHDA